MDLVINEGTDTSPLETLTRQLGQYHTEVENVQHELDQALEVWRSILAKEKEEAQSLLASKEAAWTQQETEWLAQRSRYEQKIKELETNFESQIKTTEQNALRVLNELDDAWQHDKTFWQQTLTQRTREMAKQEAQRAEERQQQEAIIAQLRHDMTHLESQYAETEKNYDMQRKELFAHVDVLKGQVALMHELMQEVLSHSCMLPDHPLRRKTDFMHRRKDESTSLFRA